jgi:hypothetical protein
MTTLKKSVIRKTASCLDGSFGPDRNKRIVVTLIPGDGKSIPDLIELRPERTQRPERLALLDVNRWAVQCRVNRARLERARERKAALARRRESRRLDAAERRFRRELQFAS